MKYKPISLLYFCGLVFYYTSFMNDIYIKLTKNAFLEMLHIDDDTIFNDIIVCSLIMSKNPTGIIDKTIYSSTWINVNSYLDSEKYPTYYKNGLTVRMTNDERILLIKNCEFQLVCNKKCYGCWAK